MFPSTAQKKFEFGIVHHSMKDYLLRTDPSEGIRSADIIPACGKIFGDLRVHQYGGALLTYALDEQFYRAFDTSNPSHVKLLDLLCMIEERFLAMGTVPPEHAVLIAQRNEG
jgi:hypothetical protein